MITTDATFFSRYLVIAAGAWVNRLTAPLNCKLPLQISKEQWATFLPRDRDLFQIGRFPIFVDYTSMNYGFPEFGSAGIKVATHRGGTPVNLDTRTFEPNRANLERLIAWLRETLPDLEPTPLSVRTCLYTNTPDLNFIVDRIPGHDDGVIVCACCGEGFKFSAEMGRVAARLLLEDQEPLARFRLQRFPDWSI